MQMNYWYASDLPFKNFCKLAKRAETNNYQKQVLVMIRHCLANSQLTRYRSKQFSYRIELFATEQTQKFRRKTSRRVAFIHSQREIKEILEPEKHTFSMKSEHKSA